MKFKFGLLPRVITGHCAGRRLRILPPGWATRIALTFQCDFRQFPGFAIPLLILGWWLRASPIWAGTPGVCWP